MKPLGKVNSNWSPELGYVVGLLATDGCLYSDGRHISLTSKDIDQIATFIKLLKLKNKIGIKFRSKERKKEYYHVQFGDVMFYRFLESIGLTVRKTSTIAKLAIPDKYFRDFVRGHLDGDGCTYSYFDPRWKNSFMLYAVFTSASKKHLIWIQGELFKACGILGSINDSGPSVFQLRYAKSESLKLYSYIYYEVGLPCLERKRKKYTKAVALASGFASR